MSSCQKSDGKLHYYTLTLLLIAFVFLRLTSADNEESTPQVITFIPINTFTGELTTIKVENVTNLTSTKTPTTTPTFTTTPPTTPTTTPITTPTTTVSTKKENESTPNLTTTTNSSTEGNSTVIIIIISATLILAVIVIILYCIFCDNICSKTSDSKNKDKVKETKNGPKVEAKEVSAKLRKSTSLKVKKSSSSKKVPSKVCVTLSKRETSLPSIKSNKSKSTSLAVKSKVVVGEGQIKVGSTLLGSPLPSANAGAKVKSQMSSAIKSSKSKVGGKKQMSSIEKSLIKARNALKSTVKSNRSTGVYYPPGTYPKSPR